MSRTRKYTDQRARRLATNGNVALSLAVALALFAMAAMLGTGLQALPVIQYLAEGVVGMALIAVTCYFVAAEFQRRRLISEAVAQVSKTSGSPIDLPVVRRPTARGATAEEVAAVVPRSPVPIFEPVTAVPTQDAPVEQLASRE